MTSLLETQGDASANLEAAQAISELQVELQGYVASASDLKRENAALKREISDARAFSKANLQRHSQWKEAWKKEREILNDREKRLEKEEARWKAELTERRKELEELEAKQALNGVGSDGGAHLNLLKELQTDHDEKAERLETEAQKWREQFYEAKANYEVQQAQNGELTSQIQREKEVSDAIQTQLSALHQSFADYVEESERKNNGSSVSEARDLKLRLEEKELFVAKLSNEVKVLQTARNDAVLAKDELVVSHQSELTRATHECEVKEVKCKALERRAQAAEKDTADALKRVAELEESLARSKKELESLKDTFAASEGRQKKNADQCRTEKTQYENDAKKRLKSINALLVEEQAKTKDLERRCLETQQHALKQIGDLAKEVKRDDQSLRLAESEDNVRRLENACDNARNEMKQLRDNHQAEIQRLKHALESCHKDLHLVLMEKSETEKRMLADKSNMDQMGKELEELQRERSKVSLKNEDLESENRRITEEFQLLKGQASADRKSEVEKYKEQLEKEKRRSQAYKGKALEAHQRSIKAKEVLDSLVSPKK